MPDSTLEEILNSVEVAERPAKAPRKKRTLAAKVKPLDPSRAADNGDRVTVEYTATLPNGRVFDKATSDNPFSFTLGANQALPAFEYAIKGMTIGETKTITIHPLEAYGIWKEEAVITVERNTFPAGADIQVGKQVKVAFSGGTEQVMKVVGVIDTEVKLDGNHPLAGYPLTYHNLTLQAIE